MRLGIFDSGIGGEAVAKFLTDDFPDAEILIVNDKQNVPYGDKSAAEVTRLTEAALQPLLTKNCDIIIIACNTATAVAIESLRHKYPNQKFIGLEPMVKTAASLTKSGVVAICATPATLSSQRYQNLKSQFATGLKIIEPDCHDWAYIIEHNRINHHKIADVIDSACKQGADVIALGCTHYHWIKELVTEIAAGRAEVIDPSEAISRRVRQLLNLSQNFSASFSN